MYDTHSLCFGAVFFSCTAATQYPRPAAAALPATAETTTGHGPDANGRSPYGPYCGAHATGAHAAGAGDKHIKWQIPGTE